MEGPERVGLAKGILFTNGGSGRTDDGEGVVHPRPHTEHNRRHDPGPVAEKMHRHERLFEHRLRRIDFPENESYD